MVLALDLSDSQTNNIEEIKEAAQSFIDELQSVDEAAIYMFRTLNDFYPDPVAPVNLYLLSAKTSWTEICAKTSWKVL